MNATHFLRAACAALFSLPFLLPVVAACGPGLPPPSTGGSCNDLACPAGAYDVCGTETSLTMTCCQGSQSFAACAMPAGILTHTCPGCSTDLCAVNASGKRTCCDFGTTPNPCDTATP